VTGVQTCALPILGAETKEEGYFFNPFRKDLSSGFPIPEVKSEGVYSIGGDKSNPGKGGMDSQKRYPQMACLNR